MFTGRDVVMSQVNSQLICDSYQVTVITSVVYIMQLQITYQHKALQMPQALEQKALQ